MSHQKTDKNVRDQSFGAPNQGGPRPNIDPKEPSARRPRSDNERLDEGLEETFPGQRPCVRPAYRLTPCVPARA
jgi:hypothetical protein